MSRRCSPTAPLADAIIVELWAKPTGEDLLAPDQDDREPAYVNPSTGTAIERAGLEALPMEAQRQLQQAKNELLWRLADVPDDGVFERTFYAQTEAERGWLMTAVERGGFDIDATLQLPPDEWRRRHAQDLRRRIKEGERRLLQGPLPDALGVQPSDTSVEQLRERYHLVIGAHQEYRQLKMLREFLAATPQSTTAQPGVAPGVGPLVSPEFDDYAIARQQLEIVRTRIADKVSDMAMKKKKKPVVAALKPKKKAATWAGSGDSWLEPLYYRGGWGRLDGEWVASEVSQRVGCMQWDAEPDFVVVVMREVYK